MLNSATKIASQPQSLLINDRQPQPISVAANHFANNPILAKAPLKQQAVHVNQHAVTSHQLVQGQQQMTATQVAQQSLARIGQQLLSVKRAYTTGLAQSHSSNINLQQQVSNQQQQIKLQLDSARVGGQRVLDAQLNVQLEQGAMRTFTVPGLNLHQHRHATEQLRLDFAQQGSLLLQFDANKDDRSILAQIDRQAIALDMRATANQQGDIVFRINDDQFQQLGKQVQVTGQGHRYPAGQPNILPLKPDPEGVEDLQVNWSEPESLRQGISKVNQHLRQVQLSLQEINQFQQESLQQAPKASELQQQQMLQLSQQLQAKQGQFSEAFQFVQAQANVRRHTVVALLDRLP